jgi:hypothetical protein
LLFLLGVAVVGRPAAAQTYGVSFVNSVTGNTDTATASFSFISGTSLTVVVTNTSTFSAYGNNDLLSGLFFALSGNPTLSATSATTPTLVNPGSCTASMVSVCSAGNVDIGFEYGFQYSATGFSGSTLTTTANYGIAAAGYSLVSPNFGTGNVSKFGASPQNLDGGSGALGGLDFSILGSGYNSAASANSLRNIPLSQNSVTFVFALQPGVTTLSVSNVTFAYGTNPDSSAGASLVPEPGGLAVLGVAAAGMWAARRRR